ERGGDPGGRHLPRLPRGRRHLHRRRLPRLRAAGDARAMSRRRIDRDSLVGVLILGALVVLVAMPLLVILVWAFADQWRPPAPVPTQWGLHYWGVLLARADVKSALPLSIALSATVTALSAAICLPAAYAFARLEFPGRRLILLSFIVVNAFPRFPLYVS